MMMTNGPWRLSCELPAKKARPGLSVLIHSPPESRLIWIKVISQKYQIKEQLECPFENIRCESCALCRRWSFLKSNYSYFIMWTISLQFGKWVLLEGLWLLGSNKYECFIWPFLLFQNLAIYLKFVSLPWFTIWLALSVTDWKVNID